MYVLVKLSGDDHRSWARTISYPWAFVTSDNIQVHRTYADTSLRNNEIYHSPFPQVLHSSDFLTFDEAWKKNKRLLSVHRYFKTMVSRSCCLLHLSTFSSPPSYPHHHHLTLRWMYHYALHWPSTFTSAARLNFHRSSLSAIFWEGGEWGGRCPFYRSFPLYACPGTPSISPRNWPCSGNASRKSWPKFGPCPLMD